MDRIEKALKKLTERERRVVKEILTEIQKENTKNLDLKKLKGHNNVFRVRKGRIRIIFHRTEGTISILSIERRTDQTYKDL